MWQETQANGTSRDGEAGTLLTCRSSHWGTTRTRGVMLRDAELLRQSKRGPEMGLMVGEGAAPEISQTQQRLGSLGLCSVLNEHFV